MHTCYGETHKVTQALLSTPDVVGAPFISRHGYESMLRQLVLDSSPRIRHFAGTVTALVSDTTDPHSISGVTVRKTRADGTNSDGEVIKIPAVFIAGKYVIAFEQIIMF